MELNKRSYCKIEATSNIVDTPKSKRELILEAAVKIFVKKGFHGSKMEEIAQEADVGKGTVYEYFPSKKELFKEMVKHSINHYSYLLKTQLSLEISSAEKLEAIIKNQIKYYHDFREVAQVFTQDHSWIGKDFTKWMIAAWQKNIKVIEEILRRGVAAGEFREMDTELVAIAFLGAIDSICTPIIFAGREVDADKTAKETIKFIIKGIGN